MLLVDLQGAAVAVTEKAKAAGVPVIAYDRPIAGADYYVSFDNETVGALQGQMVVDGLAAAGKDIKTASIVSTVQVTQQTVTQRCSLTELLVY